MEAEESWADSSIILFAAVHAGVSVTKIKATARQVWISTNKGNIKIKRRNFEGYTVSDLVAYLKRKLK